MFVAIPWANKKLSVKHYIKSTNDFISSCSHAAAFSPLSLKKKRQFYIEFYVFFRMSHNAYDIQFSPWHTSSYRYKWYKIHTSEEIIWNKTILWYLKGYFHIWLLYSNWSALLWASSHYRSPREAWQLKLLKQSQNTLIWPSNYWQICSY